MLFCYNNFKLLLSDVITYARMIDTEFGSAKYLAVELGSWKLLTPVIECRKLMLDVQQ